MNENEVIIAARLDGCYSVMRKLQAIHDGLTTRCIGSGNCCRIGLIIPLAECWNIARGIRSDYWKLAEDKGTTAADNWYDALIVNLGAALHDESWDEETNEQDGHCVFYKGGCTIYEYRPLVCRAYGVIAPVQEGVCPRKRLPDGGHELIKDKSVTQVLTEFDSIIAQWGKDIPELDFSIYMPAGVLRFLLSSEELQDLIGTTDHRFWMGRPGYKHQLDPKNWKKDELSVPVTIGRK